jgi:hypothetical protein
MEETINSTNKNFENDISDEIFTEIRSSNTVHDRYQFESSFDFDIRSNNNEKNKKYQIDMYIFIPENISINSDTYTRDNFYKDLRNYLRIKTPDLFKLCSNENSLLSLPWLQKYLSFHLSSDKKRRICNVVVEEIKLFGSYINKKLKEFQLSFESNNLDKNLIKKIYYTILSFRKNYIIKLKNKEILFDSEIIKALLLIDEYISYQLENTLTKILKRQNTEKQDIESILRYELEYRSNNIDIVSIDNEEEKNRENYYYRMGLLKKYVYDVLFLKTVTLKKEKIYKNIFASLGASLAASWATFADFSKTSLIVKNDGSFIRVFLFMFIGIIAYVFKDRLKELSREYFNDRFKKNLPDYEIKIFHKYFNEHGQEKNIFIGKSVEFMRFLKKNTVPNEILYIRNLGNRSEIDPERKEVIIHYSKKINFDERIIKDELIGVRFIRDNIRYDISSFLAKLDDPEKNFDYFHSKNGVVSVKAPKVYHLNIIFKYFIEYENKYKKTKKVEVDYERIRVVLNKKGIVRIEPVIKRGLLKYYKEH